MSNTNRPWTPGPWQVRTWDMSVGSVDAPDGSMPAQAQMVSRSDELTGSPVRRANARLIAGAPELFDALAAFVGVCDNGTPTKFIEELGRVVPAARAALAKARGEEVAS